LKSRKNQDSNHLTV